MSHLTIAPIRNVQYYEQLTAGPSPVSLADLKCYLKITNTTDDALLQSLLDASTEYGERYTARDFRVKTWRLLQDCFEEEIVLSRSLVDTVDSIEYIKDAAFTAATLADTYLKTQRQESILLLLSGKCYPTDGDDRQQSVKIEFTTRAFPCADSIKTAIKRHASFVYENRGDCMDSGSSGDCGCGSDTAAQSGALAIYDQFRISRV